LREIALKENLGKKGFTPTEILLGAMDPLLVGDKNGLSAKNTSPSN
jgi:hypothetical protein